MKELNCLLLVILCLFATSSCVEEENYDPNDFDFPGEIYFPSSLPSRIELTPTETSFSIPLVRLNKEGKKMVGLIIKMQTTDEYGFFSYPNTVTFTDGEAVANIAIKCEASKLPYDKYYDFEITLKGAENSSYSNQTYVFSVGKPTTCYTAIDEMVSYLNTPLSHAANHYEWGYGAMMHIRDVMTTDFAVVASGYDWFSSWALTQGQSNNNIYPQYIWNFYSECIRSTNKLISLIDEETANNEQLGFLGNGLAFRAMYYLDMAQMFEFLPNDATSSINESGNDVLNLTVPIIDKYIQNTDTIIIPRATREEMAEFILNDLNKAEQYIDYSPYKGYKELPNLACVYGLKARCYMWLAGDAKNNNIAYLSKAKEYARMAINLSGAPMSKDACLSTTAGFNTLSCWMWGSQMEAEDDCVKTGIINWTSWMSNETDFGYASAGAYNMIDASMYHRISDTDFSKLMWKAPARTALEGKEPWLRPDYAETTPVYGSLKFRPANGAYKTPNEGAVSAYPLMRVEEMYFIEAECEARLEGKADLLTAFMTQYRDKKYVCRATAPEDILDEVIFQKRVELWGEGHVFFDYKRLNMPVVRGYASPVLTNHQDASRFNTTTRPAWMNLSIVITAERTNPALIGFGNPDPTMKYTSWSGE